MSTVDRAGHADAHLKGGSGESDHMEIGAMQPEPPPDGESAVSMYRRT
jgi:hypothetical protein